MLSRTLSQCCKACSMTVMSMQQRYSRHALLRARRCSFIYRTVTAQRRSALGSLSVCKSGPREPRSLGQCLSATLPASSLARMGTRRFLNSLDAVRT